MNVFDLRGPEFLLFYIMLIGGAILLGRIVRRILRGSTEAWPVDVTWTPFEVAHLRGGAQGTFVTAVTSLIHRDLIRLRSGRLTATAQKPHDLAREEAVVLAGVRSDPGAKLNSIRSRTSFDLQAPRLAQYDLLLPTDRKAMCWTIVVIITAVVLTIGAIKVNVGMNRHKPVGFLVALSVLSVVLIPAICRPGRRTAKGDQVLDKMQKEYAALKLSAAKNPSILAPDEMALAFGLFGAAALAAPQFTELRRDLRQAGGDGSYVHSCSGGSSCGEGGSSCGGGSGCGGGGCGGCGSS